MTENGDMYYIVVHAPMHVECSEKKSLVYYITQLIFPIGMDS